jgi:hypothetical protein
VLDKKRLGKQRVEAFQLLCCNEDEWALSEREWRIEQGLMADRPLKSGWKTHPAALMWLHCSDALREYYNTSLDEWESRGCNNTMRRAPVPAAWEVPHWIGDDRVHATHRSRLLFKGKLDLLADRIRWASGERGTKKWLKAHGFRELSTFKKDEYLTVMEILDRHGVDRNSAPNHYSQFGWTEPDTMEYVWPQPN